MPRRSVRVGVGSLAALAVASLFVWSVQAQLGVNVHEAVDLSGPPSDQDSKELEGLLHWAIENSDPEELSRKAEEVRELDIDQLRELLEQRKQRVKELSEIMSGQLTETEVMQEIISMLNDPSTSLGDRLIVLEELQSLVGPIDNANDLKALDGISPVLDHLTFTCCKGLESQADEDVSPAQIRAAAAHVIASAASNNPKFQSHVIEAAPGIMHLLIQVASLEDMGAASKGVLALGNMIRNQKLARQLFTTAGGPDLLRGMILGDFISNNVKRRVLSIVIDLLALDPEPLIPTDRHGMRHPLLADLASAAVSLLKVDDYDLQEKALSVLSGILRLHEDESEDAVNQLLRENSGQSIHQFIKLVEEAITEEAKEEDGDTEFLDSLKQLAVDVRSRLGKRKMTDGIKVPKGFNNTKDEL